MEIWLALTQPAPPQRWGVARSWPRPSALRGSSRAVLRISACVLLRVLLVTRRRHRPLVDADAGRVEEGVGERRDGCRGRVLPAPVEEWSMLCTCPIMTAGASLNLMIGYPTQSRMVTRCVLKRTSSISVRLV